MVILENIDIDIDKAILQNIDIDKISNRFKFGISNRAKSTECNWLEIYIGILAIIVAKMSMDPLGTCRSPPRLNQMSMTISD